MRKMLVHFFHKLYYMNISVREFLRMAQYDASDEEMKRRFCKTIEVGKEVFILHDRNLFQRNRKHKILRGEISRSV